MNISPVLAIIAATLIASPTVAAEATDSLRTITVTGQAERKVVPDEAHVMVNLNALNVKLATAKEAHDKKLRTVIDIAKKSGIDEKNIRTENSNVQPHYSYENNKQKFRGYLVQTIINITVDDISKVGALSESILAAGLEDGQGQEGGQLVSVNYALSDPKKLTEDMLVAAITNARSKADKIAEALDANVLRVHQVTDGSSPQPPVFPMVAMSRMMASADSAEAAPVVPPPGQQTVNSTVTVTFELKD